jgi:hypothetical protein
MTVHESEVDLWRLYEGRDPERFRTLSSPELERGIVAVCDGCVARGAVNVDRLLVLGGWIASAGHASADTTVVCWFEAHPAPLALDAAAALLCGLWNRAFTKPDDFPTASLGAASLPRLLAIPRTYSSPDAEYGLAQALGQLLQNPAASAATLAAARAQLEAICVRGTGDAILDTQLRSWAPTRIAHGVHG